MITNNKLVSCIKQSLHLAERKKTTTLRWSGKLEVLIVLISQQFRSCEMVVHYYGAGRNDRTRRQLSARKHCRPPVCAQKKASSERRRCCTTAERLCISS